MSSPIHQLLGYDPILKDGESIPFDLAASIRQNHASPGDGTNDDGTVVSSPDNGTEESILHLDAETLGVMFAATVPSTLGVYTQIALNFTTLANGMPVLNSLPSSPTSIFLDFDGDTTTNHVPYDEDGDATTFNTTEQKNIAEAWRQISTYFAMFDTNVTTVLPTTPKAWLVASTDITGGYSYVNVFPNSKPQSFNQASNVRTRVSGLAHELGHNFGLSHQSDYNSLGVKTNEYSSGYDTLHGPIMGVDYAQTIHKWFIGHDAGSVTTLQNDLSEIAGKIDNYQPAGGDGFRADDFGGTIATAHAMTLDEGVYSSSGIIERLADVDAYSFASLGIPVSISAFPDKPSGVDLKLEIYDALGVLQASKDATTNDQDITLTLPAGTFYIYVSSHKNYGDVGSYNVTVRPLPTNWTSRDVGTVGVEGFSQYNSATDVFTIAGSGADIAGTVDEMQTATQSLTGDGTIIARVVSMSNTNTAAKSGIEIREGTGSNAKHVSLVQTFGSGQQWLTRDTVGGATVITGAATQTFAPKWLKLTRAGDVFTGYVSNDGITWTQKGTTTIVMAAKVNIGLIVSAKNDSSLNVSKFDNVDVTGTLGNAPPVYNSLPIPTNVNVVPSTGTGLNITWTDGAGETGYRVERSVDGVNFTTAGTTAANVVTYDDPGLAGSLRYYYRVKALSGTTTSAPSVIDNAINRPTAVTNLKVLSISTTQVVIDWRDTDGESGYRIERSLDGVTFTQVGTVGINIPSFTDSALTAATVYTYRVTPTSSVGDGVPLVVTDSSRLAKVGGMAFDAVASTSIGFHWSNITAEQNFRIERSTDGTTFTTLATVAADVTTYTDATVTANNEYYYRVVGVNAMTESVSPSTTIFTATPPTTAIPAPWNSLDIGSNVGDGASSYTASSGTFKVISSGSDIGSTADGFRFTYQILQGDGSITARIATQENTNDASKLGVMIRETLNPDSKHAAVLIRPVGGIVMRSRSTVAAADSATNGVTDLAPYWVRLTRAGNVLTGYSSPDGITWTLVATKTITMASKVYVGLASTATSTTELNSSTFTNVEVLGNASVTNRRLFYNGSTSAAFGNGSGNPLTSIDSTKVALLPGKTATTTSYSNYVRGINGLIIDVDGLVSATAADFQFARWNGIDSAGFTTLSVTPTISTIVGGGTNGESRVKIVFPDNAIRNTWLRVTVLANARTDLPVNDVFYFGNAVGDTYVGNSGTPIMVQTDDVDVTAVRKKQSLGVDSVLITNLYDVNKDGRVNSIDTSLVRQNMTSRSISYITAPVSVRIATNLGGFNVAGFVVPSITASSMLPSGESQLIQYAAVSTKKVLPNSGAGSTSQAAVVLPLQNSSVPAIQPSIVSPNSVSLDSDRLRTLDDFFRKLGQSVVG